MHQEEFFILCDLIEETGKETHFYICIVYSSLTRTVERVYLKKEEFQFVSDNRKNLDMKKHFMRVYDRYKKAFRIKYLS